jgi:hypothetical protein
LATTGLILSPADASTPLFACGNRASQQLLADLMPHIDAMTTQRPSNGVANGLTNGHNGHNGNGIGNGNGFHSDSEFDSASTVSSDASNSNGSAQSITNLRRRLKRKKSSPMLPAFMVSAPGKVIVFGEHAVVHGKVSFSERRTTGVGSV